MNAIQKFIEAEHKYLDLNEIDYKEYEQMVEPLRDVECVVRCKDCKYAIPSSENFIMCTDPYESQYPKAYKPIDWFCKGGERKDGDGE